MGKFIEGKRVCHAGLKEFAPRLIRGHPEGLEKAQRPSSPPMARSEEGRSLLSYDRCGNSTDAGEGGSGLLRRSRKRIKGYLDKTMKKMG